MTTTIPEPPESANGHSTISTEMIQVINYEEEFNAQLSTFLRDQQIAQLGFDYHVTAIMGPQSSGKSTLLNMLFGTKFRTMDEATGRYQVTQGVWLGRDSDSGIIVMDLEGTDSRERGEDAATYERKSSLFALALAEVLIVNVWAQDIGRYNAANMSLLKTVMELDLQLFFGATPDGSTQQSTLRKDRMHKTRLLFVLRDHVSSPFETLCNTLRADVDNIWNTIAKPEAAVGTPITDYFDLDFFALPHKVLMADSFLQMGKELRRRFQENEVFLDEYRRGVAADGFAAYAESVWETIRANRELDIPSQKEMLAHVRCEQIARDSMGAVEGNLDQLKEKLMPTDSSSPTIVSGLFEQLLTSSSTVLDSYQVAAFRYSTSVAEMKAEDLRTKLSADFKALFDAQIALAVDKAVETFRTAVKGSGSSGKQEETPWVSWGEVSRVAHENALQVFNEACDTAKQAEFAEKKSENHPLGFVASLTSKASDRLQSTLDTEVERATSDVMAASRDHCVKLFRDAFKGPLGSVFDTASKDVWERASELSNEAWKATESEARMVFGKDGLGFDSEKLEVELEEVLKPICYASSLRDIKDTVGTPNNLLMRMTKRFDDNFRFDDRGVPRHFGPNEDLETLFVSAKERGEELIELLSEIKLDGPLTMLKEGLEASIMDLPKTLILEEHSKADLQEKLKRQAGAVFMEAKRAQEAAKVTTKIPIWLFGMLVLFGWNEIMMVLRNPVLLLITVLVVPAAYIGYTMDAPTVLGPAVRTAMRPILEQAKDMLDSATAPAPNMSGVPATAVASDAAGVTSESASSTNVSTNTNHTD